MKIRKGDTVKILYGKDSGKTGLVVAVDQKKKSVIVEGLNLYKRHLKGDGRTRTSEIVTIEKPFPVSKVMFVCPVCKKTTRLSTKKDGKKVVRVCKKCGKEIIEEKVMEKEDALEKKKKESKKIKPKKVNKE
ncbi:MAG TPA: 50S ribosomal protein L24 [Candidatus Dojkabacteria bacterium]|jgi:large subunit ribosomal protein L24|nr:50S ribosomal protein L24 [Candidatus Dojkabacteria bacterium]